MADYMGLILCSISGTDQIQMHNLSLHEKSNYTDILDPKKVRVMETKRGTNSVAFLNPLTTKNVTKRTEKLRCLFLYYVGH